MMFRAKISEYQAHGFLGTPPSAMTIRRQLENEDLPGEKRGGMWFVFVDENWQPVEKPQQISDPLANQLLSEWNSGRTAQ